MGEYEFEAVPVAAEVAQAQPISGRVAEAREFANGLVTALVVAALGTVLLTAGLLIAVVGAPILAAVIGYYVVRQRRLARLRTA